MAFDRYCAAQLAMCQVASLLPLFFYVHGGLAQVLSLQLHPEEEGRWWLAFGCFIFPFTVGLSMEHSNASLL